MFALVILLLHPSRESAIERFDCSIGQRVDSDFSPRSGAKKRCGPLARPLSRVVVIIIVVVRGKGAPPGVGEVREVDLQRESRSDGVPPFRAAKSALYAPNSERMFRRCIRTQTQNKPAQTSNGKATLLASMMRSKSRYWP